MKNELCVAVMTHEIQDHHEIYDIHETHEAHEAHEAHDILIYYSYFTLRRWTLSIFLLAKFNIFSKFSLLKGFTSRNPLFRTLSGINC